MPDTKLKIKDLGTIHLMALDTSSSLFLPFGRPIAEYLQGTVGNQNGSRALLKQGAIDFSPLIRWTESTESGLLTTGFGELEPEAPEAAPTAVVEEADPAVADFLPFDGPVLAALESDTAKVSPAASPEDLLISMPRFEALPLRQRMTFGPAPVAKTKPTPVAAPKPAPPAVKATPAVVAPPKPSVAPPPRPAAVAAPPKAGAPSPVQVKPAHVVPPAPKPAAPVASPKVSIPVAPAARVETSPVQSKPSQEARVPVSPAARVAAPVKPSPVAPAAKTPAPISVVNPPAARPPAGRAPYSPSPVETVSKEARKEIEPEARPRANGGLSIATQVPATERAPLSNEPTLTMGAEAESGSFLDRIPMVVKIGVALLLIIGVLYAVFSKGADKPAPESRAAVAVGEQGWSTEWASDVVGSRRARQLTLYRPSNGMADYRFQFVGQIETKAIGWVFRASDTKNYYAMKIETLRPGTMALTHFAVVEGRESSYSQKALTVDARPGAAYQVNLDVTGPRFTVSVQGEPVDFWTDNRLKTGSVGFMNEREERGVSSSVQFSFPQSRK